MTVPGPRDADAGCLSYGHGHADALSGVVAEMTACPDTSLPLKRSDQADSLTGSFHISML